MKGFCVSRLKLLILLTVLLIMSGCATTKGSHNLVTPPKNDTQLTKFSALNVEIQCKEGISLTNNDKERILNLVLTHVKTECAERYKTINSKILGNDALNVSVVIKKYDEGNAFARFMLAGLGQMHIDADVVLTDPVKNEKIAVYEVNKTFAWGGAYGGSTTIKDIEDGFAQAVAAAIAGRK